MFLVEMKNDIYKNKTQVISQLFTIRAGHSTQTLETTKTDWFFETQYPKTMNFIGRKNPKTERTV